MSLISEALKKARGEPAREVDAPPDVYRPPLGSSPRSPLPWMVAAVSASLAVGLLIGVLVYGARGHDAATLDGKPGADGSSPPVQQQVRQTAGASAEQAQARGSGETAPALPPASLPSGAGEPSGAKAEAATPDASEVPPPLVAPPPAAGASARQEVGHRSSPPPSSSPSAPRDGASYLRNTTLPDGTELALGGIAFSDSGPVALINGEALAPGEGGEGWLLTSIEPQQVEITWKGRRFHLRLK
jgi:hypothetical protein